jgi:hypothetical protein
MVRVINFQKYVLNGPIVSELYFEIHYNGWILRVSEQERCRKGNKGQEGGEHDGGRGKFRVAVELG